MDVAISCRRSAAGDSQDRVLTASEVSQRLDQRGIFVWHGNYYALQLTETLGLEPEGMVRLGLVHYNTAAEVDRVLEELGQLCQT